MLPLIKQKSTDYISQIPIRECQVSFRHDIFFIPNEPPLRFSSIYIEFSMK